MATRMTLGNWIAVGFCILSIPITLSLLVYSGMKPDFLPSRELFWLSQIVGPLVALFIFFGGLRMFWSNLRKRWATVLSGPPLFLLMWHLFVMGPLPYLMHLVSNPVDAVAVESVSRAGPGSKLCRRSATISGDPFPFGRRLCQLGPAQVEALANGGHVTLSGRQTKYGFSYDRIDVRR